LSPASAAEALQDRYDEIWIPANEWVDDVSAFPTAGTRQETTLQAAHYDYWAFPDALDLYIYHPWVVPEDADTSAGEFYLRYYWESTETTGIAYCYATGEEIADGEDINKAYSGSSVMPGVAQVPARCLTTKQAGVTTFIANANKGELVMLRFGREAFTQGADTLMGPLNFIGASIQYHKLAANNAQWS